MITDYERKMLTAIKESPYHDGEPCENYTWTEEVLRGLDMPVSAHGGVLASLVKKGLVRHQGDGSESLVRMTEKGLNVL